jgi:hypothetical protein
MKTEFETSSATLAEPPKPRDEVKQRFEEVVVWASKVVERYSRVDPEDDIKY